MEVKKTLSADVLVVGGGNAGLVAAIESANRGARVLLIEKGPREKRGGNSRFSGGHFRIVLENGTKDLEPLLKDSVLPKGEIEVAPYRNDAYYADLMRVTEGLSEQSWAERIVNESYATATWMKEQGLVWGLNTGQIVPKDGKLFWPSGTTVLTAGNSGEGLVEMLYGIAERKGVPVLYQTAARTLLTGAEGNVCGVLALGREGFLRIEAKSVILACGGFEANPEMRRRYLGEGWDLVKVRGTRYNTGDGLNMAFALGAQSCGHWGGCHASIVSEDSPMVEAEAVGCIRYSYLFSVLVNADAKRFVDEGENFIVYTYAKMGRQVARQPGSVAYQIFDAKVARFLRPEYENAIRAESDTLDGLAEELGLDPEAFRRTIEEYNRSIAAEIPFDPAKRDGRRTRGLCPDKTNWAQAIDTPPYLGYACVGAITFSYGGLKVTDKTEVLDSRELPIPGLYAIGELSGGVFFHNYPSGTGLVKGAITARIAAREATARAGKSGG
ncbi:MAG: FAD-dependent tricarballylate dehydrogenase TcuA [Deltaproteobacteria bacterium]|nr:FAD-dependent tricarballylate dehydrogenase TcuA [Deltaproteobacteria bacterium]